MSAQKPSRHVLHQIIATVVVALLVGGTSPWWWEELTGDNASDTDDNGDATPVVINNDSSEDNHSDPAEPDDDNGNANNNEDTQEQGFRVVEVLLRADPHEYRGPCPVQIAFSGRISVVGGSGTVSYKFLRNDGASAPIETLNFDSPGSRRISTTWRLGAATPRFQPYNGWQAVKTFDPGEREYPKANFQIYCEE